MHFLVGVAQNVKFGTSGQPYHAVGQARDRKLIPCQETKKKKALLNQDGRTLSFSDQRKLPNVSLCEREP